MLHGAVPDNSTYSNADVPVQIVAVPLMVAVGRGLTVMVAELEAELLQVVELASRTLVRL
jgi:hypothetical protein